MNKPPGQEQVILTAIKRGGQDSDRALRQIYLDNRTNIDLLVRSNRGTAAEAKDVMQEAVIAFYENVIKENFKGESAISTYLYSIARFIWLNRLKRKNLEINKLAEAIQNAPEPELPRYMTSHEEKLQMLELFRRLGNDCQRVLMDSIYHNLDMKDIAQNMGYNNEQVARNKKHLCLKKLKAFIQENPAIIQFLKQ